MYGKQYFCHLKGSEEASSQDLSKSVLKSEFEAV
jgi:hypothetical protein